MEKRRLEEIQREDVIARELFWLFWLLISFIWLVF